MGAFSKALGAVSGILGGGGGGQISVPAPTKEQQELMQLQSATAQRLVPQFAGFAERAISGQEPISPALEQSLMEREKLLRADVSRRGGPGAATQSTAGIQRLAAFQRGADITREEARQRAIALGGQLAGIGGQLTQTSLQPHQQQQALQFQAAQMNAQQQAQQGAGIGRLVGAAGLGALTGGLGLLGPGIGALGGAGIGALGGGGALAGLGGGRLAGGTGQTGTISGGAGSLQIPQSGGTNYSLTGTPRLQLR